MPKTGGEGGGGGRGGGEGGEGGKPPLLSFTSAYIHQHPRLILSLPPPPSPLCGL